VFHACSLAFLEKKIVAASPNEIGSINTKIVRDVLLLVVPIVVFVVDYVLLTLTAYNSTMVPPRPNVFHRITLI